jgi:hypothetical protein
MTTRTLTLVFSFLALLFVIDRGAALVLSKAFESLTTGTQVGQTNYALQQVDKKLVVFGSSRAAYHVDPSILTEELGLSAFNAGSPGQGVVYARAIEALLMGRGTRAQVFVLHIDPRILWGSDSMRLQRLAPFYGQEPEVDALLVATSPTARYKLQIATYRYNSLVLPILGNWVFERPSSGNGYLRVPDDRPQNLEPRVEPREPGPMDPEMSRVHADFIDAARAQGIEVVLVDSPRWRPDGRSPMERIGHEHLEALAAEHGAHWIRIDEFSHPVFLDPDHFADPAHLRPKAAAMYSRLLAERLREELGL